MKSALNGASSCFTESDLAFWEAVGKHRYVGAYIRGRKKMQQRGQRHEQQRVRGRPFPPGVSGNPQGRISRAEQRARRDALVLELAGELGGIDALTPSARVLLTQCADLLMRKAATAEDHVRIVNSVDRILRSLRRQHAVKRDQHVPLRDRVGVGA
jgi:hypothetical protein